VSFDVFSEEGSSPKSRYNCPGESPHFSAVTRQSRALSGETKILAWISGNDEVYFITKLFCWESGNIREDRRFIQKSLANFFLQEGACIGFDLHISDDSQVWDNSSNAEFESPSSAKQANARNFSVGRIHIHISSLLTSSFLIPH
jgi:hypothetical protein